MRSVKASHPHLFFNWHNDVAFELLRVGRIEDAKQSLSVALASPAAGNYPEYSETRADIERHERKKIIVAVKSLPKTVKAFRLCFIAKREVLTTGRQAAPTLSRSITERLKHCIHPHAPPFKSK